MAAFTVVRISSVSTKASGVSESFSRPLHFVGLLRITHVQVEIDRVAAARHHGVLGGIDGDSIQPGIKRAIPPELRQRPIRLMKASWAMSSASAVLRT